MKLTDTQLILLSVPIDVGREGVCKMLCYFSGAWLADSCIPFSSYVYKKLSRCALTVEDV
jgi:hypothetical protein